MKKLLSIITATALLMSTLTLGAVTASAETKKITELPEGQKYITWDKASRLSASSMDKRPANIMDDNLTVKEDGSVNLKGNAMGGKYVSINGQIPSSNMFYEAQLYMRAHPNYKIAFEIKNNLKENLNYELIFTSDNEFYTGGVCYNTIAKNETETQKSQIIVLDSKVFRDNLIRQFRFVIKPQSSATIHDIDIEISPLILFDDEKNEVATAPNLYVRPEPDELDDWHLITDWRDVNYITIDGKDASDKIIYNDYGFTFNSGYVEGGFDKFEAEFKVDRNNVEKLMRIAKKWTFTSKMRNNIRNLDDGGINGYKYWFEYTFIDSKKPESAITLIDMTNIPQERLKDMIFDTVRITCEAHDGTVAKAYRCKMFQLDFTQRNFLINITEHKDVPKTYNVAQSTASNKVLFAANDNIDSDNALIAYNEYDLNKDGNINTFDIQMMLNLIAKGNSQYNVLDTRTLFLQIA